MAIMKIVKMLLLMKIALVSPVFLATAALVKVTAAAQEKGIADSRAAAAPIVARTFKILRWGGQ